MYTEYFIVQSFGKNLQMTDFGSHMGRNNTTFSVMFDAFKHFNIDKKFMFGVCTGDRDFSTPFEPKPLVYNEIVNFAYTSNTQDLSKTCPDFFFGGEPSLKIRDWDLLTDNLLTVGKNSTPEINKIGWVGSSSNIFARNRLIQLSQENTEWMDCFDVEWTGFDNQLQRYNGSRYLTYEEQISRWKYLIDIEGQGYSARTKILMFSGRVLFIADRPWKEWWYCGLEPWVHYVPVKQDLSDLQENFNRVDSDPELQQKIINNSIYYAQNNLKYINALNRWKELINTL